MMNVCVLTVVSSPTSVNKSIEIRIQVNEIMILQCPNRILRNILTFLIKTPQQFKTTNLEKLITIDIGALKNAGIQSSFETALSSQLKIFCGCCFHPELIGF